MLGLLATLGGLVLAILSFLAGRIFAEFERILAEKRGLYLAYLKDLPPLNDAYIDRTHDELMHAFASATDRLPSLLFYADTSVIMAAKAFMEKHHDAHEVLSPQSPPLHPAYQALSKAQNDLVLEMRRDAFRFSIFGYHGKSRVPPAMQAEEVN
ncbi:MAG: hypothetical protein AAGH17_04040 [Pseudomonadota bacterium]